MKQPAQPVVQVADSRENYAAVLCCILKYKRYNKSDPLLSKAKCQGKSDPLPQITYIVIRVKENNEKFNCSNEVKTKSTEYFYIGGRNS